MAQPHSVENNPNILDVPPDSDEVGLVVRVAGTVATTGGGGPSTVTADQGDPNTPANGWPVKITDGVDTVEVSSLGELLAIVNQGTSPWVVSGTVAVSSLPEPVSVDDNGGSLTVDGTVAVSNFPATQPVSGTVTANQGTSPWVVSATDLTSLLLEARITSGAMAMQVDDATVGVGTTYQGWAEPGTLTSAALWRVRRIIQTGASDSDYSITFADGNRNFDNIWDNRAALSYS